jgi:Mce-associated membrane protein
MPEEVFEGVAAEHSDVEPDDAGADTVAEAGAHRPDTEAAEADAQAGAELAGAGASAPGRSRLALVIGLGIAAVLIGAALTLTGLMLWQHVKAAEQRDGERRLVDAARDGVVALLSIDYNHARADVQRVLDVSTGQFHDDFGHSADDFVRTAEDSKAVTTGKITAAALDVVDGDRARVLVSAISVVTNGKGAKDDARPFRMSVTVTRDGDTWKMSDVEFVP